jgi:hypothetical protein
MNNQITGLYVFAGVGIAMMINSEYIRYLERQENARKSELLSGVSERPEYNENKYRSNSIGGSKTKRKKIKR